MATARATSNATTKNTNPPNNPPNNPPERSPASSELHFEVKIMVWLLSILVILFILNNHLSLASAASAASPAFETPRRGQKGEAGSGKKGTPGSDRKRTPGSAKKSDRTAEEIAEQDWDAENRYFVLNLNWGPDFVDENLPGDGSLPRLLEHTRRFGHSFTVHNFRIYGPDGNEPHDCVPQNDRRTQRREMEGLRDHLRSRLDAYWPTFNIHFPRNDRFWWYEWETHGSCVADRRAGYHALAGKGVIEYFEHVVDFAEQIQGLFEEPIFQYVNQSFYTVNLIEKYLGWEFGVREFVDDLVFLFGARPFIGTRARHESPGIRPQFAFLSINSISFLEFCFDNNSELIDCPNGHRPWHRGQRPATVAALMRVENLFTQNEIQDPSAVGSARQQAELDERERARQRP